MKAALVLGAGGFIGSHMVKRLKSEGYYVVGIDLKEPDFGQSQANHFYIDDLRSKDALWEAIQHHYIRYNRDFDEVYQFAADMGGAGYIFTGEHDADVMHNSAQINLNVCDVFEKKPVKIFYSSSACMYPAYNQEDPNNPNCKEDSAYPAAPDSEYGWEKLFSERLYKAYERNYGLNVRIARFHNIFGEQSCYNNKKEKAPAAICRKVAEAKDEIEIWGDGQQTRSFLYIDECLEGVRRLMNSDCKKVVNIGSDEMISINDLAKMVISISGKKLNAKNIPSNAIGVKGRNSDNELIQKELGWRPTQPLRAGMEKLYSWVNKQVNG